MARYLAKERGFAGALREPGDVFEFDGPKGSWMKDLDNPEEDEDDAGDGKEKGKGAGGGDQLDREQIKTNLTMLGVEFNSRAGTEALQKLLETHLAKAQQ